MEKPAKILVLEDDFINRRYLEKLLVDLGHEVIVSVDNVKDAVKGVENNEIDIALLDINLGDEMENGIEFGEYLRSQTDVPFIYLTAYSTDSILADAIKTNPASYLTKPFSETQLGIAIRLATVRERRKKNVITVKDDNNFFVQKELTDVLFFESQKNYFLVHCIDKTYRLRSTMKDLLVLVKGKQFIQTHRGFIVNTQKVNRFNKTMLEINDIEIPISKNFQKAVFDELS